MEKSTQELVHELKAAKTIETYLSEQQEELIDFSLSEYFNKLLETKNMKKADVIRASGLEKTYAYDLFSGARKNPTRDKLLALAFGFKMTLEETQIMLKYAGYAQLYARDVRDSIVIFCLDHKSSILVCNELLYGQGENVLNE